MRAVPLAFLSDPSEPAEMIFNCAVAQSGKLFVPKGSQLVIPSGPYGIGGMDLKERSLRKGHPFGVAEWLRTTAGRVELRTWLLIQRCLEKGGAVWAVADGNSDIGIVWLSEAALQLAEIRARSRTQPNGI